MCVCRCVCTGLGCIAKRYIHTYSNTVARYAAVQQPVAPATRPAGLSVTPHAFDEFVCSSTVCTVLYVPYRAVGVSMQKHQPSYGCSPTDGASVRAATLQRLAGSGWPTALGRRVEHYCCSPPSARFAAQRQRQVAAGSPTTSQASVQSKQSPGTGRCG